MSFELPSFVEMKGYAVKVMNFLADKAEGMPKDFPNKLPIELKMLHGNQAFLINGTTGLIWKRGVPKSLLRAKDADKPFNEDCWAFLAVHVVSEPHKVALQGFLFPQFAPYVHVVEIFADWQDAVYDAVGHATATAWSHQIVAEMGDDERPN